MEITHKKQTDEEAYVEIKRLNKQFPNVFMKPEKWKKLQIIKNNSEGIKWSK